MCIFIYIHTHIHIKAHWILVAFAVTSTAMKILLSMHTLALLIYPIQTLYVFVFCFLWDFISSRKWTVLLLSVLNPKVYLIVVADLMCSSLC